MHLLSIMTSILIQLVIEKNEGVHYNFPMLIMRGVCEFDDDSHRHCLQYTYMYMTKTGQKSVMIQNKQVLLNNSV